MRLDRRKLLPILSQAYRTIGIEILFNAPDPAIRIVDHPKHRRNRVVSGYYQQASHVRQPLNTRRKRPRLRREGSLASIFHRETNHLTATAQRSHAGSDDLSVRRPGWTSKKD